MALYLLVDPHEPTRKILQRKLVENQQRVIEAVSAEQALELMERHDIDVIITELRLPEMDGVELLKEVTKQHPLIRQVVLTDYVQIHTLLAAVNSGNISRLMTKPLKVDATILRILEKIGEEVVELKSRKMIISRAFNEVLLNSNRPYCLFFEDGTIIGQRELTPEDKNAPIDEKNGVRRLEFPTQFGTFILYQSTASTLTKPV
ncbi:response regulator [Exiguobacterium oxidotolerans]|uniref:response regulator n=1 Tax=Exiguobacterium oxidotolerans TaxID=223958 RepID=UPI0004941C5C|nr:response regulator [Exiguobacterium oxidotolerans]